ncbi:MAG: glycerophosphodiester phosphodiesterase, partial [Mobilitalea sp.]
LFHSKEKIPTLEQVLKVVNTKVPIIIELKAPLITTKLCKVTAATLRNYTGIYCIQSFNTLALIWYKKHLPGVVRGQLSTDFLREKITGNFFQHFLIKYLLLNFLARPDFIAYHHVYKDSLSFTLCRKLYKVKSVAWTIQTQEEYDKSDKYYDLFIFDSFIPSKRTKGAND